MLNRIPYRSAIAAFVLSTILVIVLLALGITVVVFADANLTFGLLGGLSVILLGSEYLVEHLRARNSDTCDPGERRLPFFSHHRYFTWLNEALLLFTLIAALFIAANVLTLGLLALWALVFLVLAILIELFF